MRDTFGNGLSISIFGESHGPAIGATISGIAAGVAIDMDFMAAQMDKRKAVGSISTKRKEADIVNVLSGVYDGKATGTALTLMIENTNTKSGDYDKTAQLLRPSHADYTAFAKYKGYQDVHGGGHFSGRLTAPIVAAGSIFTNILAKKGVIIASHMLECAGVKDDEFSTDEAVLVEQLKNLNSQAFAVLNSEKADEMYASIKAAASEGDSVGGILETVIYGLPAGLGEPFFDSVESILAHLMFSIPAVKGVEFGDGFKLAGLRGSVANDAIASVDGKIVTVTNKNGGINGGITNGMPVIFRTVVKPTPSIYKEQNTVDYATGENTTLQINGRHDPCIIHRARVVQDSMCAIGVADICNMAFGLKWQEVEPWDI